MWSWLIGVTRALDKVFAIGYFYSMIIFSIGYFQLSIGYLTIVIVNAHNSVMLETPLRFQSRDWRARWRSDLSSSAVFFEYRGLALCQNEILSKMQFKQISKLKIWIWTLKNVPFYYLLFLNSLYISIICNKIHSQRFVFVLLEDQLPVYVMWPS